MNDQKEGIRQTKGTISELKNMKIKWDYLRIG